MNDLRITHWSRCYVSALTRTGAQPKDAKQFADMALKHFDEFVSPRKRPDADAVAPVQHDAPWWRDELDKLMERECDGCCVNNNYDRALLAATIAQLIVEET